MDLNIWLKKRLTFENKWLAVIVFVIVTILFCRKILYNFDYWGQKDWDQFIFWNAVPRKTILNYHQFPLWNPYVNGGNVLLAHPHSSFLSPFFIFVLIFGPVIGLKLQIFVFLFLGLLGMFYLSHFFQLKGPALYLPSSIFMLNSIFALKLTEGHVDYLTIAFFPWILFFLLRSTKDIKFIYYAIVVFSLMIFSGSVYPTLIFFVFLSLYFFFQSLQTKKIIFIIILLLFFIVTSLLCSIKIFPMLEFVVKNPRIVVERDGVNLSLLLKMLTDKNQIFYDLSDLKPTGVNEWHEYGAYVGYMPIILFLVGIVIYFKKHWPLILSSFLALVFVFGNKLFIDFWDALHNLPIFIGFSAPSRFILSFIFGFSIISGLALSKINDILTNRLKKNYINAIIALIVIFILIDLVLVNSIIFKNAFVIKPMYVKPLTHFYQIQGQVLHPRLRSSIYPAFLGNCGVVNGYEVMSIAKGNISVYPGDLKTLLFEQRISEVTESHTGFAYLNKQKQRAQLNYFSPNLFKVAVYVPSDDLLIINQNFDKGWKMKEPGYQPISHNGLIATKIEAGQHQLTFYYLPNSFLIGIAVSCLTLMFILYSYFKLFQSRQRLH